MSQQSSNELYPTTATSDEIAEASDVACDNHTVEQSSRGDTPR